MCAQYCLNSEGGYFSPVELSYIAHQLDGEEKRMAEEGVISKDYSTFLCWKNG